MTTSTLNLGFWLAIVAILAAAYCLWQIMALNRLRKSFFAGKNGVDLEDQIFSLKEELKDIQHHQTALEQALIELRKDSGYALQKLGLVRFNPFGDGGGNFSFSLALLDQHNSGAIITSMYGREQSRIYTKKVEKGKCEMQLTDEEQKAITLANARQQVKEIPIS